MPDPIVLGAVQIRNKKIVPAPTELTLLSIREETTDGYREMGEHRKRRDKIDQHDKQRFQHSRSLAIVIYDVCMVHKNGG